MQMVYTIYFFDEKQIYSTDFREINSPYKESLPINGIKQLIPEIDIAIANCYQPKSQKHTSNKQFLSKTTLQNKHEHKNT
jgi:hypothetical protein